MKFSLENLQQSCQKTGANRTPKLHYKGVITLRNKHFTKSSGERRNNIVKVRFTDSELEYVKSTAELLHLSTAEYIRQMVFTGQIKTNVNLSCSSDQMNQYCYELNKIGSNLNQFTRQLNSGEPLDKEAVDCIQHIQQMIWEQSQQFHDLSGGNS